MIHDGWQPWIGEYSIWQVVGMDYGYLGSAQPKESVVVTNSGFVQNKFLVMRCLLYVCSLSICGSPLWTFLMSCRIRCGWLELGGESTRPEEGYDMEEKEIWV